MRAETVSPLVFHILSATDVSSANTFHRRLLSRSTAAICSTAKTQSKKNSPHSTQIPALSAAILDAKRLSSTASSLSPVFFSAAATSKIWYRLPPTAIQGKNVRKILSK